MIRRPPQTHIDPYEGEIITTDGKPPVNAKLTNLKMYGKSVQSGTPTPESPVPINSVAHNTSITSCGKNLFDASKITSGQYTVEENGRVIKVKSYVASSGYSFRFLPNTTYRISYKGFLSAGASAGVYGSIVAFHGGTTVFSLTSGQLSGDINRTFTTPSQIPNDGLLSLYFYGTGNNGGNEYGYIYEDLVLTYEGIADRAWQSYISSTTNLNLLGAPNAPAEWIGQPISLMSLPDGTADEYRADEGVVIKRIAKRVLNGGVSETYYRGAYATWDRGNFKSFMCGDLSVKFATSSVHILSSHFQSKATSPGTNLEDNCIFSYGENQISFGFDIKIDNNLLAIDWDSSTDAQRITALRTWLASNNVEVIYALNEPITIPVIQQPTPKSVYAQPNNIFTNATPAPTVLCGVRKLGNRPYIQAKLKDELGNFLVDENGNNIGGLY